MRYGKSREDQNSRRLEGKVMFPTPLPFDHIEYFDRGDRLRRSRARANGSRVRRTQRGGTER
jgi:hypothetical protein